MWVCVASRRLSEAIGAGLGRVRPKRDPARRAQYGNTRHHRRAYYGNTRRLRRGEYGCRVYGSRLIENALEVLSGAVGEVVLQLAV